VRLGLDFGSTSAPPARACRIGEMLRSDHELLMYFDLFHDVTYKQEARSFALRDSARLLLCDDRKAGMPSWCGSELVLYPIRCIPYRWLEI
jgi:hypothetical protein